MADWDKTPALNPARDYDQTLWQINVPFSMSYRSYQARQNDFRTEQASWPIMALNGLLCDDMLLKTTHSMTNSFILREIAVAQSMSLVAISIPISP